MKSDGSFPFSEGVWGGGAILKEPQSLGSATNNQSNYRFTQTIPGTAALVSLE